MRTKDRKRQIKNYQKKLKIVQGYSKKYEIENEQYMNAILAFANFLKRAGDYDRLYQFKHILKKYNITL